jgi:hypothetical protein
VILQQSKLRKYATLLQVHFGNESSKECLLCTHKENDKEERIQKRRYTEATVTMQHLGQNASTTTNTSSLVTIRVMLCQKYPNNNDTQASGVPSKPLPPTLLPRLPPPPPTLCINLTGAFTLHRSTKNLFQKTTMTMTTIGTQ